MLYATRPCGTDRLALGETPTLAARLQELAAPDTVVISAATQQLVQGLFVCQAQGLAGRLEPARHRAEQALELARGHRERGNEAWALRLLGDIAAHSDPPDAAEAATHYRQAFALADVLGLRPLQAHCHLGLGTLYAKIDQPEQAHIALSTAIGMYQSMDMTFWLRRAEAALAQGGGRDGL